MNLEQMEALAASHAVGALDGDDQTAFEQLLRSGDERVCRALREFQDTAALAAMAGARPAQPSPGLKQTILARVQVARRTSTSDDDGPASPAGPAGPAGLAAAVHGFQFVPDDSSTGWIPMRVPGALIKLLSFNRDSGYAVVLIRLEPGARCPAHPHSGAEEAYLLSGDLRIAGRVLRPGDFHHADAGTAHGEIHSEQGCTLLAVIGSHDVPEELGIT